MNNYDYGHEALKRIPDEMSPWNLRLTLPFPSEFGEYVLTEVDQADIELHHQVEVIDESGDPLRGVWVIFGFPGGGRDIPLGPRENYWRGAPSVLKGNAQKTNGCGYAQHTFKTGGEDIWVWDVDREGVLRLPSVIVQNCGWAATPVGQFEHTGVKLRFQRRQTGVVPRRQRLEDLEARVKALEARLGEYVP
jgi:hypothetical protein